MKTSDSRTKLLTERPIPLMISLCVPAVIGMLVVGLYSFMDGVCHYFYYLRRNCGY